MHCQYYISQDPPRTYQAINEVVHSQNLRFHPFLLSLCEGFILREGLCRIEIDPENSIWLARCYHHVPGVRITVKDLCFMELSKNSTEARKPALREGRKVHLMHICNVLNQNCAWRP